MQMVFMWLVIIGILGGPLCERNNLYIVYFRNSIFSFHFFGVREGGRGVITCNFMH